MARHDYIFVDESGDAAFTHDPVSRQLSSSRSTLQPHCTYATIHFVT